MLVNHYTRYPDTDESSNQVVSESELSVVVRHDTLSERIPSTFPGNRVLLGDLSVRSVRLRNSGAIDLQWLCELVKHLLVLLICHLAVNEHIRVWLQVGSVVTQLLQEGVILGRHMEGVLDGLTDLRWDMCRDPILVSGNLGIVVLLNVRVEVSIPSGVIESWCAR